MAKRENRRYGKNLPGLLLVEGVNDLNFLCQLFVRRGIYEYDKKQNEFVPKGFSSLEKGSYPELKASLIEEFKNEELETIGIIVDADTDIQKRWEELTKHFQKELGYSNFPPQPDPKGCVIEETEDQKRLGIWLMPDNTENGIIEHFVTWMIHHRDTNPLWQHVEKSIDTLPVQQFHSKDLAKAQIATWMAWQKSPGYPISYAIFQEYVDPHSTAADPFINWIKELFKI
jgi:hypothetical protein